MIVRLTAAHPRGRAVARAVRAQARAFLARLGREDAEISILLVGDRRIRSLNREWRGVDEATDVLSFPLSDPPGIGTLLGDVVMSVDTAARRAREEGRPVARELERYLAHGLLHLLGFDHERPEDAARMAEQEAELARDEGLVGVALREDRRDAGADKERWTPSRTSTSTRSRSGSTARGTRARSSRAGSRR